MAARLKKEYDRINRIDKLNNVGQQAFNGTDYSFGFNTWLSGTLALLRRIIPNGNEIIEQIQNIKVSCLLNYKKPELLTNEIKLIIIL
ncbi:hypothetical protein LA303_07925 [Candidatus Sulfidibacterium hydrothermale]|uniref:hypothetical protein n=1 Tax=Candidatus Sulfidibacterium hydrothermale TaxID=2875962 RepID=UPI001F0AEAD3|nr:hypothetical protein [Candidatus Sulfidibacterium hydrothermale]UBM61351.1 hypothetical protein LA303_07925 [Candidatus Sulfidibacterium hydrothermale]